MIYENPILLPQPKRLELGTGFHPLSEQALRRVRGALRSTPDAELADLVLLQRTPELGSEGYELRVSPERITLRYGGDLGRLWGLRTLGQLSREGLEASGGPAGGDAGGGEASAGDAGGGGRSDAPQGSRPVVSCVIEDYPDYAVRGVMLDVSRTRVPRMETLYELVELWSQMKVNHLQLYLEHTFAYRGHERVWKEASPFTGEEIRTLAGYCYERGIELAPNQNSFGHMERWLRHDAYKHLAECPEGFTDFGGVAHAYGTCLSPAVAESRSFVAELYDELLPHFDASTFNVGGDEPWELGQCRSKALCERKGTGRVYLEFIRQLQRMVQARGYRCMVFGDIITQYPELVPELPAELTVQDWGYEADHPIEHECRMFRDAGTAFWVLPGTSSWHSFGGRWENARQNVRSAAEQGLANGAEGFMITDWGDHGHWQQLPVSYLPWAYAAAVSWGVEENREFDVPAAIERHVLAANAEEAPRGAGGAGGLGRALERLGNAYRAEPLRLHNTTMLAAVTLTALHPYYREQLAECRDASFVEQVRREIAAARSELSRWAGSSPAAGSPVNAAPVAPAETVAREVDFTARLMDFAARLTGAYIDSGHQLQTISAGDRQTLRGELGTLREEYAALWHLRSRPGGLHESLSHFDALRQALT
jgi:hypothetical protein